MAFASGIKIIVGDGIMTKFWLYHWVGDVTLAFMFHDLYLLAMDPSTMMNTQTCLSKGRRIRAPHFIRRPYQYHSSDLNSLLTLFQPVNLSTSTLDVY